uniref:Putative secreted protein n=1 Tax=Amblyomma triste TaxID=251400 RepID=A0A023G2N2_AMBTT
MPGKWGYLYFFLLVMQHLLRVSQSCDWCDRSAKDPYQGCLGTCDPYKPYEGCGSGCWCYHGGTHPVEGYDMGGFCYEADEDNEPKEDNSQTAATAIQLTAATLQAGALAASSIPISKARIGRGAAKFAAKFRMPKIKFKIPRMKLSRG